MFRKKVLLRADTPFPLQYSFVDLQLTLQSSSPLSSLYAEIETLCWRISRRFRIAEDGKIHIAHQRSQSDAAMEALEELKDCLGAGVKKDEQLVNTKCTISQTENVDITAKISELCMLARKNDFQPLLLFRNRQVIGNYKRHQLDSLIVPQLKSFLSTKKAKVGGKKGELVTRVTAMLDLTHSLQD